MLVNLYLGDAFGWENELTAKATISRLRQESTISAEKCPKAQLIKNGAIRRNTNILKILGYIPVINVAAGIVAIASAQNEAECRPHNKQFWVCRGVAMILTGPLLAVIDLAKFIFDCVIAYKYSKENKEQIEAFNTSHNHSSAFGALYRVNCHTEHEDN